MAGTSVTTPEGTVAAADKGYEEDRRLYRDDENKGTA
jgi:hypothetical protein